jgi:hypothetical protein
MKEKVLRALRARNTFSETGKGLACKDQQPPMLLNYQEWLIHQLLIFPRSMVT